MILEKKYLYKSLPEPYIITSAQGYENPKKGNFFLIISGFSLYFPNIAYENHDETKMYSKKGCDKTF